MLFCVFLFSLFWVVFLQQALNCLQAASIIVFKSQSTSAKGEFHMPLTQKVTFKTILQKGNRVQVPKLVRWQFKMDTEQVLRVTVNTVNVWSGGQTFYAKMGKDGRITLPKLQRELMQAREQNLTGYVMEVTLEPA
jgi:bifunctional DNA-binding transcriptional regulator/antitoxin component of YhaV-PrlF toxin-antitoxin module